MSDTDPRAGLNIREAVRALVIDGLGRVLLVRFEFTAGTRWALPGGGIDAGESHHEALRRELAEEIGLHEPTIGDHLWNRVHYFRFDEWDGQREKVFIVEVPTGFEPQPLFSWEQLNAERVFELRWWSVEELRAMEPPTAPRELAGLLHRYVTRQWPSEPIELGA
jgi:8-oxo-dGTP pyrophosphatase MutT (NUDIX family)